MRQISVVALPCLQSIRLNNGHQKANHPVLDQIISVDVRGQTPRHGTSNRSNQRSMLRNQTLALRLTESPVLGAWSFFGCSDHSRNGSKAINLHKVYVLSTAEKLFYQLFNWPLFKPGNLSWRYLNAALAGWVARREGSMVTPCNAKQQRQAPRQSRIRAPSDSPIR